MKLSPILDGFIDYLKGSPIAQQTGAKFFRYDDENVFADIDAQLVPSVKGFAYAVQFNDAENMNPGNVVLGPVSTSVSVFCVHCGKNSIPLKPLEAAEILTDLHGGTFTAKTGEDIQVFCPAQMATLVSIEPFPIHAVSFELKRL